MLQARQDEGGVSGAGADEKGANGGGKRVPEGAREGEALQVQR